MISKADTYASQVSSDLDSVRQALGLREISDIPPRMLLPRDACSLCHGRGTLNFVVRGTQKGATYAMAARGEDPDDPLFGNVPEQLHLPCECVRIRKNRHGFLLHVKRISGDEIIRVEDLRKDDEFYAVELPPEREGTHLRALSDPTVGPDGVVTVQVTEVETVIDAPKVEMRV